MENTDSKTVFKTVSAERFHLCGADSDPNWGRGGERSFAQTSAGWLSDQSDLATRVMALVSVVGDLHGFDPRRSHR